MRKFTHFCRIRRHRNINKALVISVFNISGLFFISHSVVLSIQFFGVYVDHSFFAVMSGRLKVSRTTVTKLQTHSLSDKPKGRPKGIHESVADKIGRLRWVLRYLEEEDAEERCTAKAQGEG